jgi:hypothetical protein
MIKREEVALIGNRSIKQCSTLISVHGPLLLVTRIRQRKAHHRPASAERKEQKRRDEGARDDPVRITSAFKLNKKEERAC